MRSVRALVSLVLVLPFAGCVADVSPGGDGLGERGDPLTYCGGGKYVEGVDVSHYQGNPDWAKVKASGRDFAFMKATEGTGYVDGSFSYNWSGTKAAGLVRGAYHFHRTNADPIAQAEHFVKTVGALAPGDFPLMLDVEDPNNPPPASEIVANVKACLEHIEQLTGRVPIIYTGGWYWSGYMGNPSGFGKYPLWIAAYPKTWPNDSYCPTVPNSWSKWVMWQYSSGSNGVGPVPGIGQSCDRNRFDGTLADLMAFVGGSVGEYYKATYVEQSWPLASAAPIQMKVGEEQTGYIKLKNAGTSTWKAGKVLLAPIPRDKPSDLQAGSWVSATRVSAVKNDVAPGEVGTFEWDLKPAKAGDFQPYFGLVAEGITWFADAPKGGGPEDNVLQVNVHVDPAPAGSGGAAGSAGAGGTSATAGAGGSGTAAGGSSGASAGSSGSGSGGKAAGGASGASGASGAAGQSGKGGSSGNQTAGAGGSGASSGKGGSSGTGKAGTGQGGASGEAGGDGVGQEPTVVEAESTDQSGGCSSSGRAGGGAPGLGLLALALGAASARRSRRAGRPSQG